MSVEIRTCSSVEELLAALLPISHYFGFDNQLEDAEQFAQWLELERMHAAYDDGRVIGGAGALSFDLSVPGGEVPAAGVTAVGVLPSHRRRGVLTALMREQLADCSRRGEPVALLWASEAMIYGRFGYGLASLAGAMELSRDRTAFAVPFEPRGTVRLVDLDEAATLFPRVYDEVRVSHAGVVARSDTWWRTRRLFDDPARRRGRGPLSRIVLELDGRPAGYALYRVKQDWQFGYTKGSLTVLEALAPTDEGLRELWRWLLDFDWTSEVQARLLPPDHPLFLLLAEPSRMGFTLYDGVWVRLVDVGAALSARAYAGDGAVVLDVADGFLPVNAGRWRVSAAGAERTDADADLRLDVGALGSVYLGGFGFADLVRGFRAEELAGGAAARADALFHTSSRPWTPEMF